MKSGNRIFLMDSVESLDGLPVGNFQLMWDDRGNVHLEETSKFILPEKIYDFDRDLIDFCKIKFEKSDGNMGVLLCGRKGQGKSITAKQIVNEMGNNDRPCKKVE